MIDEVAAILAETAAQEILPRFKKLARDEIREKAPGDLVTEADMAAERVLTQRLSDLLPGSLVIGEEACATDPDILSRLGGDLVWVIDPVDGTMNFIKGKREFAVMVALVKGKETRAAWIHRPTEEQTLTAEKGAGARLNGSRLVAAPTPDSLSEMRLAIHTRYFPDDLRGRIESALPRFAATRSSYCAAVEYQAIATGRSDGALYWRLMPWDHAAGVLIVTECGGKAAYLDGTNYSPLPRRNGLLVSRDPARWTLLQDTLISA